MPYQVVGLLGRGGMAVVELAIDTDGRRLARKRLPLTGPVAEMDIARRRLRREAQVLARLEHPGIVPLLAVEDDGADVILVMPAMAASLADRIRAEGPLSPSEVWRMGQVLLDALAWAHRQGVVHRDIKPANVLFDDFGKPALADFGIARSSDLTHGLTLAGALLGTPEFIAPEQARGEPAGPPSDVFSLAATLTWALSRRGPYGEGDPVTLALRAAQGQVRPELDGVPDTLAGPLRAMLDPIAHRRPSAASLLGGMSGTEPGGRSTRRDSANPSAGRAAGAPAARRRLPPAPIVIERPGRASAPGSVRAPASTANRVVTSPRPDPRGPALPDPRLLAGGPLPSGTGRRAPKPAKLARFARSLGRVLTGGPARPARLAKRCVAAVLALVIVAATAWVGLNLADHSSSANAASTSPATTICAPLPYQPCGQAPAPHTDGLRCLPGWYDVDGNAADGCEATSDGVDQQPLVTGQILEANLVPVGEIDSYPLAVKGGGFFSCGPSVTVTLQSPAGVTDQVRIFDGIKILATATSVDAQPATASVPKPSCFGSDAEHLTVTVSGVDGATGADYTLTRTAGW